MKNKITFPDIYFILMCMLSYSAFFYMISKGCNAYIPAGISLIIATMHTGFFMIYNKDIWKKKNE